MTAELANRIEATQSGCILHLEGRLRREASGELVRVIRGCLPGAEQTLQLDLSRVVELDSAAAGVLVHACRRAQAVGGEVRLIAASDAARRALALFRLHEPPPRTEVAQGLFEALGGSVFGAGASTRDLLQLAADTSAELLSIPLHPARIRWRATVEQASYIGSQALPIVGLISFLVGLTIAFQSAYQLQQFGAAIYVANLIGVSMVREMGPLMTAILVAGRSGSSIAAEVSTMKVGEEVDALLVMGIDPLAYLALPRLLALMLTLPLLTALADLLGIIGGLMVGILYLGLAPAAFVHQMIASLSPRDVVTGLVKSFAFAWGIGLIGLFYGFRARGGAAEVGRMTTSSVVAAIFFIIVADCAFSVLFYIVL